MVGIDFGHEDTEVAPSVALGAPGTLLLGKYRVESTLGVGGCGRVVKARHVELDHEVAIKLLRDELALDHEHVRRFVREAQAASQLTSEHVAEIRDVGRLTGGEPYIVMELLDGADLGQHLAEHGPFDVATAVELVLQACRAIAEAHAHDVVHRDLKPSNLFLTRTAEGSPLVKVLDFGVAKTPGTGVSSLTTSMSVLGTPQYMSPEQTRSARTVDARSDLWSLGAVLHELVEGHPPFQAGSFAELCVKVATESPRPLLRAPKLGAVVNRCLARDPDDRYQTVAELAVDLAAFVRPSIATPHVAAICSTLGTTPPRRAAGHRPWVALGLVAAAIAAVIAIVLATSDRSDAASRAPDAIAVRPPPLAPAPQPTPRAEPRAAVVVTPPADPEPAATPPADPEPAAMPQHRATVKAKKPRAHRPQVAADPARVAADPAPTKPRCDPYDQADGC